MITVPRDSRMSPDIKVIVYTGNNDKLTGDGVFADTDLVRIPYNGYLIVNLVTTATGDGEIFVPQIEHKENRSNNVAVMNTATHPSLLNVMNYKIPINKGYTPRILWDKASDIQLCAMGLFYRGLNLKKINNPVALNTPDVQVFKQVTVTAQNVLEGTDLEDFPFGGVLYVYASSSGITSTIQIMQKGHQTGNVSYIPSINSGLAVNCSENAPFKTIVPATGNPTVTVTVNNSETVSICAGLYVNWSTVPSRLRSRMGY